MKFARWVFWIAGLYGLLVLTPLYFLEKKVGQDYPPPIAHPEYYYGFTGVALAWQVAFLVIGSNPIRLRPMMLPAVLEKASFAVAALLLFQNGRVPGLTLGFAFLDPIWGVLFVLAWLSTRSGDG